MKKSKALTPVIITVMLIAALIGGGFLHSNTYKIIKATHASQARTDAEVVEYISAMSDDAFIEYLTTIEKSEAERVFKLYVAKEINRMEEEDTFPTYEDFITELKEGDIVHEKSN